jgi:acetyl-CoA carboxylase carboxyltransferase component
LKKHKFVFYQNYSSFKTSYNQMRQSLKELQERKAKLEDANRPDAVAKRHEKGQRTARENIQDLCDKDSFIEYGGLLLAAQRGRKSMKELIEQTPADGLVTGIGAVNGQWFDEKKAQCLVWSYDFTVLAGTQGAFNHKKLDRMLEVAHKMKHPIVFFLEGGGGRPGDVDFYPISIGGLDIKTFVQFAKLSGKMPRIAVVSGYCFAGNAALAGCADVIIATQNVSIGMGGPAMIEGGGLGKFHPSEVGPANVQVPNGVIDVLVKDEADAVLVAKQYLSYFQGAIAYRECADQTALRSLIPENRRFAYDVRKIIHTLADINSVLELRSDFGRSMLTALIRIDGKPMGLIANNPRHLGGAIDSDASDKAARFMQLCDSFGLPILSLCDTPGFMVGPDYEQTALVRHTSRMFLVAANVQVPVMTVVTRRGYGLGAMAMSAGGFHESLFTIAWDSGEFGAMNLEGAVRLGFKKELEAVAEGVERNALFEKLLQKAYQQGQGINAATVMEIDDVIDPKDTRTWIVKALNSLPKEHLGSGRFVDSW